MVKQLGGSAVALRRVTTSLPLRGLKSTATFMASLREARAELELRASDGIVQRGNERFLH